MVQTTMYPGINNSPQTSLTAGITATDTTIPVAAVEGVFPAGPNLATIGVDEEAEVIRYQSISGYTLVGCERGFDGTTAKPWNQNELIYRGFTKYDHNSFKANIEDLSLNKLDATGDGSDVTAAFSAAASRTNIATGEKLSAIFGKIAKYFADLKALSFKDTVATEDIDNSNVTNAKLAQMATHTIKGNAGSGTANPSDLSAADVRGILNVANGADVTGTKLEATSAIDAVADGDKVIIEDVSASAGSQTKHILWSAVKTALNSVYAPLAHASRHASGGADAVTPAAIGAAASSHAHGSITNDGKLGSSADLPVFTLSAGVIGTKNKADAKIALDIDARGFEYGGREIPLTWAQIKAKVAAGDFTGLRIGDYKDIALNGSFYDAGSAVTKTLSNNVMRMEIAGIDSYYHYADTDVPHHIDFISRDCVPGVGTPAGLLYNTTATNSGGYIGSSLFTTLNGTNGLQKLLPADVAAVILNKRGLTEVKTGASASSWAWNDMGKLWLPTEQEVWGQTVWAEHGFGGGLAVQYPIFQNGLRHIVKGNGNGGSRYAWWCASSVAASAANFCVVGGYGTPANASAANSYILVPVCFRVA